MRFSRFGNAWLVIFAAAGCGGPSMDYGAVNLIDAYGRVTLDAKPLPGAVVAFEAPDGQFSYGLTDSNGKYQLQFDSAMQGVTPGPKTVRISTTRKILGLNTEDEEEGEGDPAAKSATAAAESVPARYNKNSELTVEVTADREEYNFDLASR